MVGEADGDSDARDCSTLSGLSNIMVGVSKTGDAEGDTEGFEVHTRAKESQYAETGPL